MYVTAKERCYALYPRATSNDGVTSNEVFSLRSNHEEGDTRLLLHANHAAATYDKVIIKSPDKDVLILVIAMQLQIQKEIFFLLVQDKDVAVSWYQLPRTTWV